MKEPLVSADCDLRNFPFMPLDVVRLRDSSLAITSSDGEFRAAVLLWCASWHQIPAASLPDDDAQLAQFAGYGRAVSEWLKVKEGALRGWIKCSDGRFYHPVIAEKAQEAHESKLRQRWKTECARIKKQCQRNHVPFDPLEFSEWKAAGCPFGDDLLSLGRPKCVPRTNQGANDPCPESVPGTKAICPDFVLRTKNTCPDFVPASVPKKFHPRDRDTDTDRDRDINSLKAPNGALRERARST